MVLSFLPVSPDGGRLTAVRADVLCGGGVGPVACSLVCGSHYQRGRLRGGACIGDYRCTGWFGEVLGPEESAGVGWCELKPDGTSRTGLQLELDSVSPGAGSEGG